MMTLRRKHNFLVQFNVCLQGSSRQFGATAETFTGSHQQKCMVFPVKWAQFYLEEKGVHAISLFHRWITLQRGAV